MIQRVHSDPGGLHPQKEVHWVCTQIQGKIRTPTQGWICTKIE